MSMPPSPIRPYNKALAKNNEICKKEYEYKRVYSKRPFR